MSSKIYLIELCEKDGEYRYYAEHGEMGGIPDAIGYECSAHARKFRSEDEALHFLQTQLPQWGHEVHRVVGLDSDDFTWDGIGLAILLRENIPIPDKLLEPAPDRLRIWRR